MANFADMNTLEEGGGGFFRVKSFAVIVLSKKTFPTFLTLEKCLRGHDIKSSFQQTEKLITVMKM